MHKNHDSEYTGYLQSHVQTVVMDLWLQINIWYASRDEPIKNSWKSRFQEPKWMLKILMFSHSCQVGFWRL